MEFRKYTSIENSYNQELIQQIRDENLGDEVYVVQEKAHGGNLSIWTDDGINFLTAKRTAFLERNDKFYNHYSVMLDLRPKLEKIWNSLSNKYDIQHLTIFGEIIGGIYPHPQVNKDKNAIQVQKGVYYSPSNEFYAFDILLNNNQFLPINEANDLFELSDMLYAKTIFKGSLNEVLQYSNTFQSTISKDLNLPEIKGNTCEGVVIKILSNTNLTSGKRIVLKNKNEKWAEREKNKKRRKKPQVGEEVKILISDIGSYVTDNRLSNVISKIGEITEKDFGRVMGLFSKDVIEDFEKDYKEEISLLENKELKLVTKSITGKMAKLLKERLKKSS